MAGKIFVISAPSGAGKSTLVKALLEEIRPHHPIKQVITYTSRQPRGTERDGYDYHFLTEPEFENRIAQGFFIEWSCAYGTYYGSPRSIMDDCRDGMSSLLIIDRVGAEQVKVQIPDAILIWIDVPNIGVLRERLVARGTENEEQIERRLKRAEIEMGLEFQKPLYRHHILNDDFSSAFLKLMQIFALELNGIPAVSLKAVERSPVLG